MSARLRFPSAWAAAVATLYTLATSGWYVIWRQRFAERSADEAMFENMLWNQVHGHGLRTWIENGVPHLAVHFSPALYLLAPLYALTHSMIAIHFVTAALIGVAGVVFHQYAARALGTGAARLLMIAFLLCPTIVLQTFMEFHEQALAVLPLTLLLVGWLDGHRGRTLLAAAALLAVREDNALLVIALGLLSLFDRDRRATGLGLLACGLAGLALWRVVAVGLLGGGALPNVLGVTYSKWGTTPGEIVRAIVGHPVAVIRHLLAPVPIQYLVLLLAPVLGLLAFGSPLALVLLPQLLMVLLADHDSRMFQIRMHYSIAPAVVLFVAAVPTLQRIGSWQGVWPARLRRWAPAAMLAVAVLLAPGWGLRAAGRLNPYAPQLRELIRSVPETTSVAAPGYLLVHLAARQRIALLWSEDVPATNCVVLEDSSRFFLKAPTVDVFHTPRFDSLLTAAGYERTPSPPGWYVFQRRWGDGVVRGVRRTSDAPPR